MNLFKKLLICCYLFNNINLILGDKVSEEAVGAEGEGLD